MRIRLLILSGLAAVALAAAPARADEWFVAPDELASAEKLETLNQQMTIDLSLFYDSFSINNSDGNVFGGGAKVKAPLSNRWMLYGHLDYANIDFDVSGFDVDQWNFGGGAAWRNPATGTFGIGITQSSLDFGGSDFDFTSYAAFAECYHGNWTIGGHFAGYSGDSNFDGWGLGGHVKAYATPNFALSAGISYAEIDSGPETTAYKIGGDFKLAKNLTLGAHYTHAETDLTGGTSFDTDTWGLRLNLNFGDYGAAALQDADRTGAPYIEYAFPIRHTF